MSKSYYGKTCPYCKTPLTEGEPIVVCGTCDMPHHLSCWQDNQGCTTFGCTGSIKEIIGANTAPAPTAPQGAPTAPAATLAASAVPTPAPAPAPVQPEKPIEVLYESKDLVLMADIPLALENTALIIDRVKDQLFARCTFKSITDKAINAVLIEISCQDVWGSPMGEPISFQYLDLKTKRESRFGQTTPIALPDKAARRIQVVVKKVLFSDSTVVSGSGATYAMPAPVLLSQHLNSQDLAAQYARETTPKAQYIPVCADSCWRCTCGALNTAEEAQCHTCHADKDALMAALDLDALTANMTTFLAEKQAAEEKARAEQAERIRLAQEQVRLEQEKKEQERLEAEQLLKKKKRKKRNITIAVIAAILVAVLACGFLFVGLPYLQYESACTALENGDYDAAYKTFVSLGEFMDSEAMAKKSLYQKGKAALDAKRYDEAIGIFTSLGSYSDSQAMLAEAKLQKENAEKEARYQEGIAALNNKQYDAAIEIFAGLNDYADSKEKLEEARRYKENAAKELRYQEGIQAFNNGQYDDAIAIFTELGNYAESKSMLDQALAKKEELAKQARYEEGIAALNNKKYDTAIEIFKELGDFADSKDKLKEAQEKRKKARYEEGLTALNNQNYDRAVTIFTELGSYSDSKDKLVEAKYGSACNYYNNRNYKKAATLFAEISQYQDSATKLTESMYGYVLDHQDNQDTTTFDYLKKLKSQGYKDAASIYTNLYKWRVTGIINATKNDYTSNQANISKYCSYLHAQFKITGGTPGEKINVTHTTYFPSGGVTKSDWHWNNKYDGSSFGCEWSTGLYNNPSRGKTGTLTIKVYNLDTGEFLGEVSTNITN